MKLNSLLKKFPLDIYIYQDKFKKRLTKNDFDVISNLTFVEKDNTPMLILVDITFEVNANEKTLTFLNFVKPISVLEYLNKTNYIKKYQSITEEKDDRYILQELRKIFYSRVYDINGELISKSIIPNLKDSFVIDYIPQPKYSEDHLIHAYIKLSIKLEDEIVQRNKIILLNNFLLNIKFEYDVVTSCKNEIPHKLKFILDSEIKILMLQLLSLYQSSKHIDDITFNKIGINLNEVLTDNELTLINYLLQIRNKAIAHSSDYFITRNPATAIRNIDNTPTFASYDSYFNIDYFEKLLDITRKIIKSFNLKFIKYEMFDIDISEKYHDFHLEFNVF